MSAPARFILADPLRFVSPDAARGLVKRNGFECRTAGKTAKSEIWVRADPSGNGYWIVRMDTQGHATSFRISSRPHYHKNWVANDQQLSTYLTSYDPTAHVYDDDGVHMGEAAHSVHPEHLARAQHIPR